MVLGYSRIRAQRFEKKKRCYGISIENNAKVKQKWAGNKEKSGKKATQGVNPERAGSALFLGLIYAPLISTRPPSNPSPHRPRHPPPTRPPFSSHLPASRPRNTKQSAAATSWKLGTIRHPYARPYWALSWGVADHGTHPSPTSSTPTSASSRPRPRSRHHPAHSE